MIGLLAAALACAPLRAATVSAPAPSTFFPGAAQAGPGPSADNTAGAVLTLDAPTFFSQPFPDNLARALERGLEGLGAGEVAVRPERRWFTYGRERYRLEFWSVGDEKTGLAAVRFGPLLYMDDGVWARMPKDLRKALAPRTVRMNRLAQSSPADSLAYYTFPAVAAMLEGGFAGRRVVDAGSGDGLLALTAVKLGASRVDLVEVDPGARARAGVHLELNGFKNGKDYHVIPGDLTRTYAVLRSLPPSPLPTVVLGSVGTWNHDYTATNADILALAAGLAQVERVILTGYASGAPMGGLFHLYRDKQLARLLGWRIESRRGSWSRWMADLWPRDRNNYFHLAFVARAPADAAPDRAAFERELARRRSEHGGSLAIPVRTGK